MTPLKHVLLEFFNLAIRWKFTGEEKPESTLWNGLPTWDSLWCLLLNLEQVHASILNTVDWVKLGGFIQHSGKTSHTADNLRNCYFSDNLLSMLLVEFPNLSLSGRNETLHLLLESRREHSLVGLYKTVVFLDIMCTYSLHGTAEFSVDDLTNHFVLFFN